MMALFSVKRYGRQTMLVIEAATLVAANGRLVFQDADGQTLAILQAAEVLGVETVPAVTPPAPGESARRAWVSGLTVPP